MKWTIGYCLKFRLESLNYSQEGAALLLSNLRKSRNLKVGDVFDPNELMDLMNDDKAVTRRILLNLAFREEINLLKEQFLKFAGRCDFNY